MTHISDPRNCTYHSEAKARGIAARCQADDEDGWSYRAEPIAPNDHLPTTHVAQWWAVVVYDEAGHQLGNL